MRITFCALNSKFIHSTLAVWYLSSAIEGDCAVVEGTINEDSELILERILKTKPDTVAFSTYIWNKNMVLKIAEKLKRKMGIKILLGGPEVSYNAKEILEGNGFVDYVICGEGEEPIYKFYSGINLDEIEGLCYKNAEGVVIKPPHVSSKEPPNPYTKLYLDALNGRIAYLETSRGCPFRCAFCLSGRCGGVRFFDLERAKKDIVLLANSGAQTVKLIDRTFNADRKRARKIFEFIINEYGKKIPTGVCFHFEIEGELLEEQDFEVLKKAPKGLIQFEIGLQSFNKRTLDAINRKTNLDLLYKNIEGVLSLGNIHTHIDLIIGLPYEEYDSFKNSFNMAYGLDAHMLQVGFLKLLHGAELRSATQEHETDFTDTPPYEIVSNKWISKDETEKLHSFEDVFEKMYNSQRFALTCKYLCEVFDSPFDIYMGLAEYLKNRDYSTLDKFTLYLKEHFESFDFVDNDKLRDMLAIDRLATNKMGALPDFLKVKHPSLKKTLNFLERDERTKRPRNVKRAATPMLTENKIAYVDYDQRDYLTNRFLVKFTEIYDN